jgi:hypothetical protein
MSTDVNRRLRAALSLNWIHMSKQRRAPAAKPRAAAAILGWRKARV